MVLGRTLDGFFTDEYERFNKGLATMAKSDRERLLTTTRRDLADATQPRVVTTPAWDDVIHIRPRLQVSASEKDEYWKAIKAGRAPDLGGEVIAEIERRRTKQDYMRRSAQPEFDRAWGSVMTAIDNVQDFLAAVSVFGRIALTVGSKVGLRAIPGLGALVTAADLLTLTMLLGQLAFPGFLALCAGPRAGLRAGLGTALTLATFKGTTALLARASSRSLNWNVKNYATQTIHTGAGWKTVTMLAPASQFTPGGIAGAIGAGLVIAQTTDQLWGYGLSLGPIVGGTMGAVYGAEAKSRGLEVEVRPSPSAAHFGPRVAVRLHALSTEAIADRLAAADILASAILVLDPASPAEDEDRALTIAALLPALGVLAQDWEGTNWQDDVPRLVGWAAPPPPPRRDRVNWTHFAGPSAELPPQEWPHSWGGKGYIAPQGAILAAPAAAAGAQRVIDALGDLPAAAFYGAAVLDGAEALWSLYGEDPTDPQAAFTPPWLAAERMTAVGVLPNPTADLTRLQAAWDEAIRRVTDERHGMMTREDWRELYARHDVPWIEAEAPPTS